MSEPDPLARFGAIYAEACATGIVDPNAMILSTVGSDGRPSSRAVLLKAFDERGFVFYTNFESRKGREILAHPDVCLLFYWRETDSQVRIEGRAERVSDAEADAYFATRDHGSKLGAWASRQSRAMKGRRELLAEVAKFQVRFPRRVPRPPYWSGFRVVATYFEFWRKGKFRLHERTAFEQQENGGWKSWRLFP